MRIFLFALLLVTVSASPISQAESYARTVHLELDAVEGATQYEIQIKNLHGGKAQTHKLKEPAWSGKLEIGNFEMKTRTLDYRGVPGAWSDVTPFDVGLEKPVITSPAKNAVLPVKKNSEALEVNLEWKAVPLAKRYQVDVTSSDGALAKSDTFSSPKANFELPVGHHYQWKITSLGPHDLKSEASSEFEVAAGRLESPQIAGMDNDFVRQVHWNEAKNAQSYDVDLYRRNSKEKKWELTKSFKDVKQTSVDFDPAWPGGIYKVDVRAKADHWQASNPVSKKFRVHAGDRSPAAEYDSTLRLSIDHLNGWYGVMAYMVTDVQFTGSNYDGHPTQTYFSGLGGTGRVGGGYQRNNQDWGVFGIADLSGLKNGSSSFTYASMEASAVWRKMVGARGEFRSQMGVFYKEIPVAEGNAQTGQVYSYQNAATVGPHVDAEYWYSMTPTIGLQGSIHLYESIFAVKTPNGEGAEPSLSTQVGLAGSYRVNNHFTGLLGFTRRTDALNYKSLSGPANAVTIQGNYLSLYAEYGF